MKSFKDLNEGARELDQMKASLIKKFDILVGGIVSDDIPDLVYQLRKGMRSGYVDKGVHKAMKKIQKNIDEAENLARDIP